MKKKVFLKISQNLQGNTCARVAFLIQLQNLVADIIFGITQKLLYITLSNLVRYYISVNKGIFLSLFCNLRATGHQIQTLFVFHNLLH